MHDSRGRSFACLLTAAVAGLVMLPAASDDKTGPLLGFDERCSLADGSLVKLIRPPHPASRMAFLRHAPRHLLVPPGIVLVPENMERASLVLAWRDGNLTLVHTELGGTTTLATVLTHALGVGFRQLRGDGRRMNTLIPGDIVINGDADAEDLVADFERLARDELKEPIQIAVRNEIVNVVVAHGNADAEQLAAGGLRLVFHAPESRFENRAEISGAGTWRRLLREVGNCVGAPIIDDAECNEPDRVLMWTLVLPQPQPITDAAEFRDPKRMEAYRKEMELMSQELRENGIKALQEATGVTLREEKRMLPLMYIEDRALDP